MTRSRGFNTRALHAGERCVEGSVTQPIFQSSTYVCDPDLDINEVRYGRLNNTPNHEMLSRKIASLEGTEDAVVTASGMSAVTTAILSVVGAQGHLLAQDNLYGGTYYFLRDDFPFWGRNVSLFPADESDRLEKYLQPNTKAIYVEAISNPLLKIPHLEKVTSFAKQRGILTIIDSTFASPVNLNPASLGFDVIIHSATKYLNGHTDVLAGAIAGKSELLIGIRKLLCHLGPTLDPHACFLLNRGIKTLGLRVNQQNKTAMRLARALEGFTKVKKVYYPGLPSHPNHQRAKELFRGWGGVFSFDYAGTEKELETALERLTLFFNAPSLGGVESLITRPCKTSHSGISKEERERLGITDTLVRVSVGLEDAEDLENDFRMALEG